MEFVFTYQIKNDKLTYFATIWSGDQRSARALLKRTTPQAINIKLEKKPKEV